MMRRWLTVTESMGTSLPDGRHVIVRRGDKMLIETGPDGLPKTLSVVIQIRPDQTTFLEPQTDR